MRFGIEKLTSSICQKHLSIVCQHCYYMFFMLFFFFDRIKTATTQLTRNILGQKTISDTARPDTVGVKGSNPFVPTRKKGGCGNPP